MAVTMVMAGCNDGPKLASGRYSGRDVSAKAGIVKDPQTQTTQVKIDINDSWQLFAGPSDKEIDFSKAVASGETGGTFDVAAPFAPRRYFQLSTPEGKAILAERQLPMEGGHNYRDMGGYRTADGHYVRWGRVFRTDDMHNLTDADLAYLAALPLRTVVDFRSEQEIAQAPDKLPQSVATHSPLSISPGNLTDVSEVQMMDTAQMAQYMIDVNRSFSTDGQIIGQYRRFFELLQDETNLPLSFHCTAGKDRTGMAAALFLSALGVPEEVVMQDYLLSNKYLSSKYGRHMEDYPALRPLFTVDARYLKAGLDRIKTDHGTVQNYLRDILEVDIRKMKKLFLYR